MTIFKLGFLGPSSLDGFWNSSDWLYSLLRACQAVKAVYSTSQEGSSATLACVPVDLAARAIVSLSTGLGSAGGTYVLNESSPGGVTTLTELLHRTVKRAASESNSSSINTPMSALISASGRAAAVTVLSFGEWMQRLREELSPAAYLRAEAMFGKGPGGIGMVMHNNAKTCRVLVPSDLLRVDYSYWDLAIDKLLSLKEK